VTDPAGARLYVACWRELVPAAVHQSLVDAPGADPGQWWVATGPVPVRYSPTPLLFVG
jgi:hypothetical protein